MFRLIFKLLRAAVIFTVIAAFMRKVVRPRIMDRWEKHEETDE
jgi:flagellar biosynthesis/type III secretory pathway M-ring protein FliF/YscJ